jgi:hypothetical protein
MFYPYSFIPLVGDPDGRSLSGHAAIWNGQPSAGQTVTLTGQTPLLVALLELDGADPEVPRRAYDVAGPSGLSAPAMPDGRRRQRRACGSWK